MKNKSRIRDMTFEICGRILKTVSRTKRVWTLDLMSLNILMILKARNTVAVEATPLSDAVILRTMEVSVARTMKASKIFQAYMKYIFLSPISLKIISTLKTKANR